jgi:hypothetical protein
MGREVDVHQRNCKRFIAIISDTDGLPARVFLYHAAHA